MAPRSSLELLRKNAFLVALFAYASAVTFIVRLEAVPAALAAVRLLCLAVLARLGMQLVHAASLTRRNAAPRDYLFMSTLGFVAAAGVLWGLSRNVSNLPYLAGHWILCWLVFSAEMHYNQLAQSGAIDYLGAARPFRYLALRSLRFAYGGEPSSDVRGPIFFVVMLTTALLPALPAR